MRWAGYQTRFLEDTSRQIAVVKSRRIGFSEVACFRRACRVLGVRILPGHFERTTPAPQMLISSGFEQSKDVLARVMFHVKALTKALAGAYDIPKIVNETKTYVEFDRMIGSTPLAIRAFSNNPTTIRSFAGDLMLDEFGSNPKQQSIWRAAYPLAGATLGNREPFEICMIGTPLGDDNMFHDVCKGSLRKGWSVHEVTILDARSDGFPINVDEARLQAGDEDSFNQEYMCSFLSSSARYIPEKLYDSRVWDQALPGNAQRVAAGMDVARHGKHKAAIVELARLGDTLYTSHVESRRGTAHEPLSWESLEQWADETVSRCGTLAIDASGMGDQFGARMERAHGSSVLPIKFTMQAKDQLFSGLRLALERKMLWANDDPDLRRAALSIRRKFTQSGNTVYDIAEDAGGHGDEAVALALAVHAAGGAAREVGPSTADIVTTAASAVGSGYGRPRRGGWR